MSKKTKGKENKEKGKNIFDIISADDAFAILKILADEDEYLAKRIEQLAVNYLSGTDIDDIALQVYSDLDSLEIEEAWDHSGSTRHGYVDPGEAADEMFEEALEPYVAELKKYQKLQMMLEAKNYCPGILKGIYKFDKESTSDYKDLVPDTPGEYFTSVLDEWEKGCSDQEYTEEVSDYIDKNFKGWR